ncbi:tyrosine-type recombinase/integrase [bacterium]|nr:tyrosine-type recombinase/integrase [bacterium]
MKNLALTSSLPQLPALVASADEKTAERFLEFFAASIRNPNTRHAYMRACAAFLDALQDLKNLAAIKPLHVAAYVEKLTQKRSAATVKQHVAAIRQMFDYLVTGQIIPSNPASSVKPPKQVSDGGKTPILQAEELRQLFASLNPDVLIDARDRAILAVMTFSFARVGAVVKLRVRDYYRQGAQAWFLLREKGGRDNKVPVHHEAASYVERYLELARIADQRETPLFRSAKGRTRELTDKPMLRGNVFDMIRRRTSAVGLPIEIGCHSFRGSGITNYLSNGGTLEVAARIAGHRSTTTTQLYDRRSEQVSQAEIERIRF